MQNLSKNKIGLCTGCFDVLHIGHVRLLEYAKNLCDELIVGINSDSSIKKLKGNDRPINSEEIRKEFLLGLKYVDHVEIFCEDTPSMLIKQIQPDIFVKGYDYDMNILKKDCMYSPSTKIIQFEMQGNFSTTNILKNGGYK